jgi:hypothetical protein
LPARARAAPIGSRRDVIEEVDFFCGRALEKQRQSLRTLISELEPLVPTLGGTVRANNANANSLTPPPDPSGRNLVADAMTHGASLPTTPRERAAFPTWLAVLFAVAGIAAAAFFGLFIHGRNNHVDVASQAGSAAPSAMQQGQAMQTADIDLVLLADKPIVSVQAPGAHHIDIAGKRATVSVMPWAGAITIEATLDSGGTARATAIANGPHELLLEQVAAATSATQSKTATAHTAKVPTAPTATHGGDINLTR